MLSSSSITEYAGFGHIRHGCILSVVGFLSNLKHSSQVLRHLVHDPAIDNG